MLGNINLFFFKMLYSEPNQSISVHYCQQGVERAIIPPILKLVLFIFALRCIFRVIFSKGKNYPKNYPCYMAPSRLELAIHLSQLMVCATMLARTVFIYNVEVFLLVTYSFTSRQEAGIQCPLVIVQDGTQISVRYRDDLSLCLVNYTDASCKGLRATFRATMSAGPGVGPWLRTTLVQDTLL